MIPRGDEYQSGYSNGYTNGLKAGRIEMLEELLRAGNDVIAQARQILIHASVSEESAEHVLLPRYLVGALRDALTQLDR